MIPSGVGWISLHRSSDERNRTLCSKANDVSLSRTGLELWAVVDEQFREQVQNVE